jgi:RecA/RadA recombinase
MKRAFACTRSPTYNFHLEDVTRKALTINKAHVEQQVKIQTYLTRFMSSNLRAKT